MAMSGGTAKLVKTGALGDSSATCKLYVYYKTSQDVANNKSTISVGMYIVVSSGWNIGSWTDNSSSYVGKTSLTFDGSIPAGTKGTKWLVENKTFTVNHNTDGTGTATIYWKWGVNSSWGNMVTPSGSFKITLPTIPRKSSISASNAYIGNKSTLAITRASSNFTHTLQYKISGQSSYTTIVSKTSSTSYSWTIPESAYNYISDGKVTITIKCITYSGSTNIGEATTTLTATAKAASNLTASSAYVGKASTITISPYSSSFKHTIQYKITGQSSYTTIATKTSSTSYSWTIPTAAYDYISSTAKTVKITINCITYYGEVNLGAKTTTLTATCLESACKPTLSPTVKDTGSSSIVLTGDADNIVIKGFNVMSYTIGATAKNGATIKSQKITCGNKSNTAASGKLSYVSSNKFTITATDSRGYTSSTTITKKTLINYVRLTCALTASATLAADNTATLTIKASGNWFNGSFGATTNTLVTEYRYKTNSGSYSSWTSFTPTKSGNTYSATKTITGLDYTANFTVQVRAYDAVYSVAGDTSGYGMVTPAAKTVSAKPVFDWGKDDFNFNVPVKMPQNVYFNTTDKTGGGLMMNNSDISGCNAIIFGDVCNSGNEGINFIRADGNWDVLKCYNGKLNIIPNYPTNENTYGITWRLGDSITLNTAVAISGFVSSSTKGLYVTIPLNRCCPGCTSIKLSGKMVMRGVKGYITNTTSGSNTIDFSNPNGFSYTTSYIDGVGVYISITFTEALTNATNNTPVCCAHSGGLTITFN